MSRPTALAVEQLSAGYDGSTVIDQISFSVRAEEICALLGANGAGKTTTLKSIAGLLRSSGTIVAFGSRIAGLSPEKVVRRGVALVPEGRGTFPHLTVEENLRVGATLSKGRQLSVLVDEWLQTFPSLANRRAQKAGTLSGGEQQMLAIARAMMSQPRLLLLDEPSMGLAPQVTAQLFADLRAINARTQTAMLLVEQNANLALDLATRAYVLEGGRISISGPAHEVASDDRVKQAYLHA